MQFSIVDVASVFLSVNHYPREFNILQKKKKETLTSWAEHDKTSHSPGGGGGAGYSHTLPIRVCAAQRGRDFEAPDLERGIHFRGAFQNGYNISNARKLQFCKQPFEIIQGQIAFKNTVQCVYKQTVVLLLHPVL